MDEKDFQALLNGELPNGVKLQSKEGKRRLGYDLTFSAPKSFSLIALLPGGDPRFLEIHNRAVKKVLDIIEKDTAEARFKTDGIITYEKTENLTFALFPHDTSREGEPQLHTHAVKMNVTERSDGEWRALASSYGDEGSLDLHGTMERILRDQKYYGMLYQAELAKNVVELGHEVEAHDNGTFDIAGIPKGLCDGFSTRRLQIEAAMQDMDVQSRSASDVATLNTRKAKTITDRDTLCNEWLTKAATISKELNFDFAQYIADAKDRELNGVIPASKRLTEINVAAQILIHDAIDHISQYQSVLDYEGILQKAVSLSVGKCAYNDLIDALDHTIAGRVLIAHNTEQSKFTTDKAIHKEVALIDALTEAQKKSLQRP